MANLEIIVIPRAVVACGTAAVLCLMTEWRPTASVEADGCLIERRPSGDKLCGGAYNKSIVLIDPILF